MKKAAGAVTAPGAASATQPRFKGIWEPVNYSEDAELQDVCFVTADVGWVSGYDRSEAGEGGFILHTRDAGQTWTVQSGDPHSGTRGFKNLYFLDETHGWAASWTGRLLRTTDGETWETMGEFPTLAPYLFTSETTGFYVTGTKVYQTLDAGRTWKAVFTCQTRVEVDGLTREVGCNLEGIHFPSPSVGYAVSRDIAPNAFALAKTEDGGNTWNVSVVRGYSGVAGVLFTDESTGLAYRHGINRTADGGQTWTGVLGGLVWGEMKFADPEVGWICQGNPTSSTLTYTTDGGKRWLSRVFRLPAGVNAFSLPRRDRGYVVGDHGMIYRYSVVPMEYTAAGGIDAPTMPAITSALDDQVTELEQQVQDLGTTMESAPSTDGTSEAASPGGEGTVETPSGDAGSADGAGWVETHYASKLQKLQATLSAIGSTIPQFGGKFRNLNLIFAGLQLLSDLTSRSENLQSAFRALRMAKDPESAKAAMVEVTGSVQSLAQTTKSLFQHKRAAAQGGN
jgi:photosystem II stability/assembly factor-like uncharacterized protein